MKHHTMLMIEETVLCQVIVEQVAGFLIQRSKE